MTRSTQYILMPSAIYFKQMLTPADDGICLLNGNYNKTRSNNQEGGTIARTGNNLR